MAVDYWVVMVLVTINIAALSALFGVIWAAYKLASDLDAVLNGMNGDDGFIEETTRAHKRLANEQEALGSQLRLQSRFLDEIIHVLTQTAEEHEDIDGERLEDMHERARDSDRWRRDDD